MPDETRALLRDAAQQRILPPRQEPRFFPCYQPIVSLGNGLIAGYEALARTRTKEGTLKSAAPIFTDGLYPENVVRHIDRNLRQKALATFSRKHGAGFLCLNISPFWVDQLGGGEVSPTLRMIEEAGIDPQRVIIEITERQGDIDNLRRFAREYQKHGIRIAIDDFGSGASQVDRVLALEPDLIKLDMALFKQASRGGVAADIALSITAMAKRMGCQIVCEGIETEKEFHFAVDCETDFIQGWAYGKASESLQEPESTQLKTRVYKSSYLKEKGERYSKVVNHQMRVYDTMRAFASAVIAGAELKDYHHRMLQQKVVRYFYCDLEGNQSSPNYELSESGQVVENNEYVGSNWSHRPYFPLLIGVQQVIHDQIVSSNPYRDHINGQMCKTFCLVLSEQHVLLVDVLVEDVMIFDHT